MVRERSLERVGERGEMRGWKDVAEETDEKNRRRKIYINVGRTRKREQPLLQHFRNRNRKETKRKEKKKREQEKFDFQK